MNNKDLHILSLETSGLTSGVAVSQDDQILGQISLNIKNIHSRRLALLVDQLFEHIGLSYQQISAIAVSAGPGSFTGLRIGYSLVKGLAHSLDVPIVEVSTLDVWAYQQGKSSIPVVAIIDAHRSEVFLAKYEWDGNAMVRILDYQLKSISDLPAVLDQPALFVGGDILKIRDQLADVCGEYMILPEPMLKDPQNWALVKLAYKKFMAKEFSSADSCEPQYLRAFKGVM